LQTVFTLLKIEKYYLKETILMHDNIKSIQDKAQTVEAKTAYFNVEKIS